MSIVVRLGEIQLTVHGVMLVFLPSARLSGPSSVGLEKFLRELDVNHIEVTLFYG